MQGLLLTTLLWFKYAAASAQGDAAIQQILNFNKMASFPAFEGTDTPDENAFKRKEIGLSEAMPDNAKEDDDLDEINTIDNTTEITGKERVEKFAKLVGAVGKQRGSLKDKSINPKALPHRATDKMVCGNPICVVLDQRPRRFKSVCSLIEFLDVDGRDTQVNFIQKGDCYDIIDNNEGAKNKAWTDYQPVISTGYGNKTEETCALCKKDEWCQKSVVLNIDIQSMIKGQSSAFGGETFNEIEASRLPGIPLEFENVCEAMKHLARDDNLNKNTQVIGFAVGRKKDLFPLEGDKCLWTEWFDFKSPCLSKGEGESYQTARQLMGEQRSGPLRICGTESIMDFEWAGGSVHTRVSADTCLDSKATGLNTGENSTFGLELRQEKYALRCINDDNNKTNLPPPFLWPEDKNVKCLDFKSRYCCKSSDMFRPVDLGRFSTSLYMRFPLGSVVVNAPKVGTIEYFVTNIEGCPLEYKCTIEFNGDRATCTCDSKVTTEDIDYKKTVGKVEGSFTNITKPDGSIRYQVTFKKSESVKDDVTINIGAPSKDGVIVVNDMKVVQDNKGSVTVQMTVNKGKTFVTTKRLVVSDSESKVEITTDKITRLFNKTGAINVTDDYKHSDIFANVEKLNQDFHFGYLIESPPLNNLFAECEWKDWVNQDYPEDRDGYEFELKQFAENDEAMTRHVCGREASSVYFVDAVTVEDQIPWYELKQDNTTLYEVAKLTPHFGYACVDANMPGNKTKCIDMKLRYCCAKQARASWAVWGTWSECSATCGGGETKRTRKCKESGDVDEHRKGCYGESQESNKVTVKDCNIFGCPDNMTWTAWGKWSTCSESCGMGSKERKRSCSPPLNGGIKCPHRVEKKDLYDEKKKCSMEDCDVYMWAIWMSWSSCSKTCGQGEKVRSRKCLSDKYLKEVPDSKCGRVPEDTNQQTPCLLSECPINGGWSVWTGWERCSQNCIYDSKSKHKDAKTKANKKRMRYCTNPAPNFGGTKCTRDEKHQFDSNQNSEVMEELCTIEKDNLKYCPENCIFTEWGPWTNCDKTCLSLEIEPSLEDSGWEASNYPRIYHPPDGGDLPKKERYRVMTYEAKHNGTCLEKSLNTFRGPKTATNGVLGYLHEIEQCPCCTPNTGDWYTVQPVKFDPKSGCVGYCPVNCEWNKPIVTQDPQDIEQMKERTGLEYRPGGDSRGGGPCWELKFGSDPENKRIKNSKQWTDYVYALKAVARDEDTRKNERTLRRFDRKMQDLRAVEILMTMESTMTVKEPIYDPLIGGKPCLRPGTNASITRNYDLMDGAGNEDYELYYDIPVHYEKIKCNDPSFCMPSTLLVERGGIKPPFYCRHFWTNWGPWSKCSRYCGPGGKRTAKRKCTECGQPDKPNKANPPKGQCTPSITFNNATGYTSEKYRSCSPCPSDQYNGWADWSDWSTPDKTCGTDLQVVRTRKCNDDYMEMLAKDQLTEKIKECEGTLKERKQLSLAACAIVVID